MRTTFGGEFLLFILLSCISFVSVYLGLQWSAVILVVDLNPTQVNVTEPQKMIG